MKHRLTDNFLTMLNSAVGMAEAYESDALLVMLDAPVDWDELGKAAGGHKVVVVADQAALLEGSREAGLHPVVLEMGQSPVLERLTQALLESVADEVLAPGADVVALYSGFEAGQIDSVSVIHLDEHLRRLTVRDLRQLETSVPLDTLKMVVDLAVEIGREGREGKPVGTLFVVGSTRAVLERCHATTFDPMKGYKKSERNLGDRRVREGIKEIAQMDGAFIVAPDGTVVAAAQYLDASADGITLSKGLGARHWAAAAISRKTRAVAVAVSETNGTVRIFQNGDVVLRIEPFRLPMKWKEFEFEPPASGE